jgi:hypothetical protein
MNFATPYAEFWHYDQVSVIRHQTPSKNQDAEAVQFFGHKLQVESSISIGLENRNGSHARCVP